MGRYKNSKLGNILTLVATGVFIVVSAGCSGSAETALSATTTIPISLSIPSTPSAAITTTETTTTATASNLPASTNSTTEASVGTTTSTAPSVKNLPPAGLYAIWYTNHPDVVNLPYISGGQIVLQWGDIEKVEGQYDFSSLDKQLEDNAKTGFKTTVQINGDRKPAWLFQQVPYNPSKLSVQIGDPLGTLMYWHPAYIKAYLDLLTAYAQHLKNSPYLALVAGVRQNFDAIGTEIITVPTANQPLSQWVIPTGGTSATPWTQAAADEYQRTVLDAFVNQFSNWVYVFVRNTISDTLINPYLPLFENGRLGWFQTSSEVEPRGQGGEAAISRYYIYCLTGETIGYAEPMADAWGFHGGIQDTHWASPPQWNYWRLLNDLSAGVALIAIYGDDLNVAQTGKYARGTVLAGYQQEFTQAFEFAAKYAGFISQPQISPGAWVAFRHSDYNILQKNSLQAKGYANAVQTAALTQYTDDYTFLIQRLPDKTVSQTNIGPDDQRYGAWARLLPANETMRLAVNDTFAKSLEGTPSVLQITYLDSGSGSFSTTISGQIFSTILKNTGRWQVSLFPLAQTHLAKDTGGADISVQSVNTGIYFHMVEIFRAGNNGGY